MKPWVSCFLTRYQAIAIMVSFCEEDPRLPPPPNLYMSEILAMKKATQAPSHGLQQTPYPLSLPSDLKKPASQKGTPSRNAYP